MIAECDNEGFMDFIQKCKSSTIIQQKTKKNTQEQQKQQQPYNTNKTKQNKKQTQTNKTSTIYTVFKKNRFPLCYFSVSANAWKPLHIYTT